jgi:flagellar biosynthesis chaperone FliJ
MDKGTQKEVNSAIKPLKKGIKMLSDMAGSDNKELRQLAQSMALAQRGVLLALVMYGRKTASALELLTQVLTSENERLCKLEDRPGSKGESQQLYALRKRLAQLEKGLQKHDPMLQFLEEYVEAKRDKWLGKGGGTVIER